MATIRKTKAGTYRVEIRRKGITKYKTLRTLTQAKRWANEVEDSIRLGQYNQQKADLPHIFERYRTEIVPLKKSPDFHLKNLKQLSSLKGITPSDVVDYVMERRKAVSSSTVLKEINTLNHVLKTAISIWRLPIENPVPDAKHILAVDMSDPAGQFILNSSYLGGCHYEQRPTYRTNAIAST